MTAVQTFRSLQPGQPGAAGSRRFRALAGQQSFAGRVGREPAGMSPEDTKLHVDLTFVCSSPCGRISNGSLM